MRTDSRFNPRDRTASSLGWRWVLSLVAALAVFGFASPALSAVDSYTIGVDGMACPFCAYGIEKKLKAVDGIESLDIRIKDGEVDVTVAEGGSVTPEDLNRAIKEAGFAIRDLTVTATATLEEADGGVRATLSDEIAFPVDDYDGETGEFEIRAEILNPANEGRRQLRIIEQKE